MLYGLSFFHIYHHGYHDLNEILGLYAKLGKIELIIPLVLASYTAGHITSYLSSITIEKYLTLKVGYPSHYLLRNKNARYFNFVDDLGSLSLIKLINIIILLPLTIIEILLEHLFRIRDLYASKLDDILASHISDKINELKISNNTNPNQNIDYFRIIYHYTIENLPTHKEKLRNYVALFGFTRTTAFTFCIFSWISFLCYTASPSDKLLLYTTIIFSLLSFIMYLNFAKLYRRFSLEVLMAIASQSPFKPETSI